MKTCYNCNRLNKDNDRYCRYCGKAIRNNSYYTGLKIGIVLGTLGIIIMLILYAIMYL